MGKTEKENNYKHHYGDLVEVVVKEITEKHIKVLTASPQNKEGIILNSYFELYPKSRNLKAGETLYVQYIGDLENYAIFGAIIQVRY